MSKTEKTALVPTFRFPEFLGEQAWNMANIGTYLKESRIKGNKGDTAKKLTVKSWGNGVNEKRESTKGSENTQYYCRKTGQFIYSKLDFLNQAFGIIPSHLNNFESTIDLPCFDVSEKLDVRFLLEYVQREAFYKKYGEFANGVRKAKRIQSEVFLKFPICMPKLPEQQKIVDCLFSIDELIAAEYQKLEIYKSHKKGLLQKLFPADGKTVPECRFPEFVNSGEWESTTLEKVIDYENGRAHENEITEKGEYILVNSKFISSNGEVRKYTNSMNLLANKGDILMVLSDLPNGKSIAKCYLVNQENTYTVNQRICKLTPKNEIGLFLFHIINRNKYFLAFDDGIKQTNLKKDDVLCCPLLLPKEKNEQQKIANCLSSFDDIIIAQTGKIEALKTHKKGLIQGLFPSIKEGKNG